MTFPRADLADQQQAMVYRCNLRALAEYPDATALRLTRADLTVALADLDAVLAEGAGSNRAKPAWETFQFVAEAFKDMLHHATLTARKEAFAK